MTSEEPAHTPESLQQMVNDAEDSIRDGNFEEASETYLELAQIYAIELDDMYGDIFERAIYFCEKSAALGHPDATGWLALISDWADDDAERTIKYLNASIDDSVSQRILANYLILGKGVHQSFGEARVLLERSAVQSFADAIHDLACLYDNEDMQFFNQEKAIENFRKAAIADHGPSEYRLALKYFHGDTVEKDHEKALELLKKVETHGAIIRTASLQLLIEIYKFGYFGIEASDSQFLKWSELAKQNDHEYRYYLAKRCLARGGLSEQTEGLALLHQLADETSITALLDLFEIYSSDEDFSLKKKPAINFFESALEALKLNDAILVSPSIALRIADLYFDGDLIPRDIEQSLFFYEHATRNEWMIAKHAYQRLITIYNSDVFMPKNYEKTFEWTFKAAKRGYADMRFALGMMFMNGKCVDQSNQNAKKWITLAADQCHSGAMIFLENNPRL